MTSNSLVCPFLTDDSVYAYGVEFGMLFARMRGEEESIADYFTTWNQDQILLLAAREGWRVTVGEQDEFWFWCQLERGTAPV